MPTDEVVAGYSALAKLHSRQLELTPQYAKGLRKRFVGCDAGHLRAADHLAACIERLAGDELDVVLQDYDWICQLMIREEIHFRRSGRYRLSTFAEALAEVYSNDAFMHHYMNGLLVSQVWWSNHTETFRFYRENFLAAFARPFRHLEIGPGHGLLLLEAGASPLCESLECWDVSPASIEQTRAALDRLGATKPVDFKVQDLFQAGDLTQRFDSIVMSEVLEHLERPDEALRIVRGLLAPGGRLFVNMPVNSPAPDHIYLLTEPEAVAALVEAGGFKCVQTHFAPQTGMSLERALRMQSTVSVAIVAEPH